MKKLIPLITLAAFILTLTSCKKNAPEAPATTASTGSSGSSSGGGPAAGGSGGSASTPVTIVEPFSAKFTYSAPDMNNIFEKQTIHLDSKASGVVQYVWNIGNGTKIVSKNPDISYIMHGYYTVTLTVTDKDGNTASSS